MIENTRGFFRCALLPWRENARLRRWISNIGNADFERARGANETILQQQHIIRVQAARIEDARREGAKRAAQRAAQLAERDVVLRRERIRAAKPRKIESAR